MLRQALKEGNPELTKLFKLYRKSSDLHNLQIQLRKFSTHLKKNDADLSLQIRPGHRIGYWNEMNTNRQETKSTEPRILQPPAPKRIGCNSVSLSRSQRV